MPLQIITYPQNPNVYKALIAAQYGGVTDIEQPEFEFGKTNRTEEFYKINPLGKVPAAKTEQGEGIFESNAIARYVAAIGTDADGLLGKSAIERARIDQWQEVVTNYIAPDIIILFGFKIGYGQYNAEAFNKKLDSLKSNFEAIERHFTNTGAKFLTGDRVTIADIILISTLVYPLKVGALDASFRSKFPLSEQYLRSVLDEKQVAAVVGPIQFVEKFEV